MNILTITTRYRKLLYGDLVVCPAEVSVDLDLECIANVFLHIPESETI